jgi:hypothetical protein
VIIIALRIDRDRAARTLPEDRERILIGAVVDAEHDDRAHIRPQPARIGASLRILRQPIHVAMGADLEKFVEVSCRVRDRVRRRDADAVEAERARFLRQRAAQIEAAQKSSST